MGAKTKKTRHAGKFRTGFGVRARQNYNKIEDMQRTRQQSPFHPKGRVKRIAAGIWKCLKTGKIFAGPAYYLDR